MFTVGIICGGPSAERGISLNSARTLQDHLDNDKCCTKIFFVNHACEFFQIDNKHLYSNTPSDFDFKMKEIGSAIDTEHLAETLGSCDIIFPVIHGAFGEDGKLQNILENLNIPYVGSNESACQAAYLKNNAQEILQQSKFPTLGFLNIDNQTDDEQIESFWKTCAGTAILKPCNAGSSIDIHKITSIGQLQQTRKELLKKYDSIQWHHFSQLQEITIVVLCNQKQEPIALLPTETEILSKNSEIYDYRAKYLPTTACRLHTPARLTAATLQQCRASAESIFKLFGLRDFARLDGWVCPKQGFICTDINIFSGFEENSFLFKQSSLCGLNHEQTVHQVLECACARYQIQPPKNMVSHHKNPKPVYVIFGGSSTERQVSLMSGRNVWFKLLGSSNYQPTPFFLDKNHQVWQLPYHLFLHHTVEEIIADIDSYTEKNETIRTTRVEICNRLDIQLDPFSEPKSQSLESWAQQAQEAGARVLLALHGGIGENGTIQSMLRTYHVPFNGSTEQASEKCMNKQAAIEAIESLHHPDIIIQKQKILSYEDLCNCAHVDEKANQIWSEMKAGNDIMIIKPLSDGCSSGIVCLRNGQDLKKYAALIEKKQLTAPANSFYQQPTPIELPGYSSSFLIESYIATDMIHVHDAKLSHHKSSGWLELTVVVLEKNEAYEALQPSITVSNDAVLSVEEKFQGGTGINLTPPPKSIISCAQKEHIRTLVAGIAKHLKINQYARLDIFYNIKTNKLQLIEANTLPALTPSTVLFQQALAHEPPMQPRAFIETLVTESTY